jgi:hypothetical protein
MLIKDFIDERPMVSLFTRPRRFGKTLNMDMLRTYFEKTDEDTSVYFKDKKIWSCGDKYRNYQGKYPVIFITFKDIKFNTWAETFEGIRDVVAKEARRHGDIQASDRCDEYDKKIFGKLMSGDVNEVELSNALLNLSHILHKQYDIAPIIIIDEYDTPIQQGYMKGYYDEVIGFMRNFLSGGLKDNRSLSYGFLTGILRVAKESIFSGLNNLVINSILDQKYSEYFGFTKDEVQAMANYYGTPEKCKELCEWYDGYRFGEHDIFNPWSVINYFRNNCRPGAYWQSTGSNDIIGDILTQADEGIYERLNALMQGESVLTLIDTGVVYPQIRENPSTIYSFLMMAGYLKAEKADTSFVGDFMCQVSIPNKEIMLVYSKEILQKMNNLIPMSVAVSIQEALYLGNAEELQKQIKKLLMQSVSVYDAVGENFYHGLCLGLCAVMDNRFYITSNRESGEGRYDIQLMPKRQNLPGILIELKAAKNVDCDELQALANTALKQIEDRKYDTEMIAKGVNVIYKYGVAFSGKNVEIVML